MRPRPHARGATFVAIALATSIVTLAALGACSSGDTPVDPPVDPPPVIAAPDTLDPAPPPPLVERQLTLEPVADGFESPLYLTAPTGDRRLFVVERGGRVRIVKDGATLATPFLDLTSFVDAEGPERGMLSLAFDPRYAHNGWVYVAYTAFGGDIVVSRYTVLAATPDRADVATELTIIRIPHLDPV